VDIQSGRRTSLCDVHCVRSLPGRRACFDAHQAQRICACGYAAMPIPPSSGLLPCTFRRHVRHRT
jgi:hypothetical protein